MEITRVCKRLPALRFQQLNGARVYRRVSKKKKKTYIHRLNDPTVKIKLNVGDSITREHVNPINALDNRGDNRGPVLV